jgi:carboxyl-terminal processing protease
MNRGRFFFLSLSLLAVFLLAVGTLTAAGERQKRDGEDSLYKYLAIFSEAYGLVDRAYVDEMDGANLMSGAFEGTLDALDPFAYYVPAGAQEIYERVRRVGSSRSGLVVLKERGVAYILAVEEGSPADVAGIEAGRILSEIQGLRTRPMPLLAIHEILAGDEGTEIEVETLDQSRGGVKEVTHFRLGSFPRSKVELAQERGVPVLRVPGFYEGVEDDVIASLEAVKKGPTALEGLVETGKLVLDLRGVAGGDPATAYKVAGYFADGELGALRDRGEERQVYNGGLQPLWSGEIAVLIDRGTQGAAEIVARVLDQRLEAQLVGEGTFGHSGESGLVPLSNGAALQITQAFYTGPDREPINESLPPDLRVFSEFGVEEEEDPAHDAVLEKALEALFDELPEEEEVAA